MSSGASSTATSLRLTGMLRSFLASNCNGTCSPPPSATTSRFVGGGAAAVSRSPKARPFCASQPAPHHNCDVVVGADGVHSSGRRHCSGSEPTSAPLAGERSGVRSRLPPPLPSFASLGGHGRLFGIAPLSGARTYFYCSAPVGQWSAILEVGLEDWIESWCLDLRAGSSEYPARRSPTRRAVNYDESREVRVRRWYRWPGFHRRRRPRHGAELGSGRRELCDGRCTRAHAPSRLRFARRRRTRGRRTAVRGRAPTVRWACPDRIAYRGDDARLGVAVGAMVARRISQGAKRSNSVVEASYSCAGSRAQPEGADVLGKSSGRGRLTRGWERTRGETARHGWARVAAGRSTAGRWTARRQHDGAITSNHSSRVGRNGSRRTRAGA